MHYATTLYKGSLKRHNKEVRALNYETTKARFPQTTQRNARVGTMF